MKTFFLILVLALFLSIQSLKVIRFWHRSTHLYSNVIKSSPSDSSIDADGYIIPIFKCSRELKDPVINFFSDWLEKEKDSFTAVEYKVNNSQFLNNFY